LKHKVILPESLLYMAEESYGWGMLQLLGVGEVKVYLPLLGGGCLIRAFKR
jgi:hypothetical protein